MGHCLFGIETEYAAGGPAPRQELVGSMMRAASERLSFVQGVRPHDHFLANGGRLYVDQGDHLEFCTPECDHPADAVRFALAGDRTLEDLRDHVVGMRPELQGSVLLKSNVDYLSRSTWASHESYLTRRPIEEFQDDLVAHLVSRIVLTGAGGFDPRAGLRFSLSPRASFIVREASHDSTRNRGIFNTRDEPLANRGYQRLHVLCGESLCSHAGAYVRVGATALVVAMIDAKIAPGPGKLCRPVAALRCFALDPLCGKRVRLHDGRSLTASEIQRIYLESAERHAGERFMPPWAGEVCKVWRNLLDRLEAGAGAVAGTLDWAIKQELFASEAERCDLVPESLPAWERELRFLDRALGTMRWNRSGFWKPEGRRDLPPGLLEVTKLRLEARGFSLDQLPAALKLRFRLFELDARFGELHPHGIFRQLEQRGDLDHAAPGVTDIDRAREEPPASGRAKARGRAIRALARLPKHRCDWHMVLDGERRRILDLRDPFVTDPRWSSLPDSRGSDNPMRIALGPSLWIDRLREMVESDLPF